MFHATNDEIITSELSRKAWTQLGFGIGAVPGDFDGARIIVDQTRADRKAGLLSCIVLSQTASVPQESKNLL
jgi:hypothetical protein